MLLREKVSLLRSWRLFWREDFLTPPFPATAIHTHSKELMGSVLSARQPAWFVGASGPGQSGWVPLRLYLPRAAGQTKKGTHSHTNWGGAEEEEEEDKWADQGRLRRRQQIPSKDGEKGRRIVWKRLALLDIQTRITAALHRGHVVLLNALAMRLMFVTRAINGRTEVLARHLNCLFGWQLRVWTWI